MYIYTHTHTRLLVNPYTYAYIYTHTHMLIDSFSVERSEHEIHFKSTYSGGGGVIASGGLGKSRSRIVGVRPVEERPVIGILPVIAGLEGSVG
jgi:hypothetical protein